MSSTRVIVPESANMGLAYIKLRLATLNVRLQSLLILLKKKNENISKASIDLNNIVMMGDALDPNVANTINDNERVKNLFDIYKKGLTKAYNEINSL